MPTLVDRHALLLPRRVLHGLLKADLVEQLGLQEVVVGDLLPPVLERHDQRLVDDVLDASGRIPQRRPGQLVQIHLLVGDLVQVVHEDVLAALGSGKAHVHLAIEPPRPQQGRVEGLGLVGGADDEDVVGGDLRLHLEHAPDVAEPSARKDQAVHLDEQLVHEHGAHVEAAGHDVAFGPGPGLADLSGNDRVVPPGVARTDLPAGPSHRVELVDEHHRAAVLVRVAPGFAEEGRDPQVPDADEHVGERGTARVDERHVGLAGDGLAEERLPGPRRALEQDPVGRVAAALAEILEPLEQLHHVLGGLDDGGLPPDVVEVDVVLARIDDVGPPPAQEVEEGGKLDDQDDRVEQQDPDEREQLREVLGEVRPDVGQRLGRCQMHLLRQGNDDAVAEELVVVPPDPGVEEVPDHEQQQHHQRDPDRAFQSVSGVLFHASSRLLSRRAIGSSDSGQYPWFSGYWGGRSLPYRSKLTIFSRGRRVVGP